MFRKNYKKAMDRITTNETTDKKIDDLLEEDSFKRSSLKSHSFMGFKGKALAPVLALGLVIMIIAGLWPRFLRDNSEVALEDSGVSSEDLEVRVSYEQVYKLLAAANDNRRENLEEYNGAIDEAEMSLPNKEMPQDSKSEIAEDSSKSTDYSETNIQEEGVDEADIVKTDGRNIYMSIDRRVEIVKAEEGSLSKVATIDFADKDFNLMEMYLQGDRLVLIGNSYQVFFYENDKIIEDRMHPVDERTIVYYFDVSNPGNPKNLGTTEQSGGYVSSRVVDGSLYLITNKYYHSKPDKNQPRTYVPSYKVGDKETVILEKDLAIAPGEEDASYLVICAFNLKDRECTSSKAILGAGRTVYGTKSNIYVAMTRWKEKVKNNIVTAGEETLIIGMSMKDGALGNPITGVVPGYEVNQFAMDEHKGYLRIVTTETRQRYEQKTYSDGSAARLWKGEDEVSNGVYVLDKDLKVVGGLSGLAPGEYVYSVRFYGDIAYFVTFRQVDPLFTVDLRNPKEPVLIGSLKIPGFSDYLQSYGEGLLLGFGQAATEEGRVTGLKLSMFDVTSPEKVEEIAVKNLENKWSEASYNHKAILASPSKNLIAFSTEDQYFIYGYDREKGFYEKASIDLKDYSYNTRGIYIGDYFYLCTNKGIGSYDINKDFVEVDSLKF